MHSLPSHITSQVNESHAICEIHFVITMLRVSLLQAWLAWHSMSGLQQQAMYQLLADFLAMLTCVLLCAAMTWHNMPEVIVKVKVLVHIAAMFDSGTWQDHDELVHCVADNIDLLLAQVRLVFLLILAALRVCNQPAPSTGGYAPLANAAVSNFTMLKKV